MGNSNLTDPVEANIANSKKKKEKRKNKIFKVPGLESRTFSLQSERKDVLSPTFIKINAGNLDDKKNERYRKISVH